jgi:hypothetical protein
MAPADRTQRGSTDRELGQPWEVSELREVVDDGVTTYPSRAFLSRP